MSTSAISKALPSMNTQAVAMVLEGKLEQAISLFHCCLDLAMQLEQTGDFLKSQNHEEAAAGSVLSPISLDDVLYPRDQGERATSDNCFRFFGSVFVLEGFEEIKGQKQLVVFIMTVLYNLAVLHQEIGLGSENPRSLSVSFRLYHAALDWFSRATCELHVSFLEMALYNNLGHILAFFSDTNGVLRMRSKLFNLVELGPDENETDHFGFRSFFRSSLVMVRNSANKLSPAA